MDIGEFIDTSNKDHVKALDYLRTNGHWPIGFLPDDIEPQKINEQIILVTFIIANQYVDKLLKEIK